MYWAARLATPAKKILAIVLSVSLLPWQSLGVFFAIVLATHRPAAAEECTEKTEDGKCKTPDQPTPEVEKSTGCKSESCASGERQRQRERAGIKNPDGSPVDPYHATPAAGRRDEPTPAVTTTGGDDVAARRAAAERVLRTSEELTGPAARAEDAAREERIRKLRARLGLPPTTEEPPSATIAHRTVTAAPAGAERKPEERGATLATRGITTATGPTLPTESVTTEFRKAGEPVGGGFTSFDTSPKFTPVRVRR